ncbi:MAG: cell division protein ZapB [Candidatus Hydrogenedentes bacterium]|nr:cell division protein ZapB [Candidatus Hydrogenedentota bacterium]
MLSICLLLLTTASGNLLVNPGFEAVRGDMPIRWDLFVMPQEGCYGEVDPSVHQEGKYSGKLHNGRPYDKEPANNWSQSITTNLRNKELLVRGWIKTEAATEAALWLQCFQRRPLRIVAFASTGDLMPIYGDMDWTEVEMRVPVPNETDFVMLRCVLLGEGSAWFDDLSVEDALESKAGKPVTISQSSEKAETPRRPETKEPPSTSAKEGESLEELRATRQALTDANRTLRELNTSLLAQINALQEEVQRLREEIEAIRTREPAESLQTPGLPRIPWPEFPVPPLVPHKEQLEEDVP